MGATRTRAKTRTTQVFCESCRIFLAANLTLKRHNTMVHKPIRTRKQSKPFIYKAKSPVSAVGEASDNEKANSPKAKVDPKPEAEAELKPQVFTCPDCQLDFEKESDLSTHQEFHNKLFKCDHCYEEIRRADYLEHLGSKHAKPLRIKRVVYPKDDRRRNGPNQLFLCENCWPMKVFFAKEDLEQHEQLGQHVDLSGNNRFPLKVLD